MKRGIFTVGMVLLLFIGLSVCMAGAQQQPPPTSAVIEIDIIDYSFQPDQVEVIPGTIVRWTNRESRVHGVSSVDGLFESEQLGPGDTFRFTFDDNGTYDYICSEHPWVQGQIIVTETPGGEVGENETVNETMNETIVDLVVENEDLTTLATAVVEANLTDVLSGEGPFTVFAPDNDAFDALPEGALDALLNDTDTLTSVLTYHVVAGTYLAEDLTGEENLTTVQGTDLSITFDAGNVLVNDASVIEADIEASNGVVHVVDSVLLPIPDITVVDQEVAAESVTIAEVVSTGPAWVVIHADDNGAPGEAIGWTGVGFGSSKDVSVTIDVENTTETLYAMLHEDTGEIGVFEFPDFDGPVEVEGEVVTRSFAVTLPETAS